PDLSGNLWHNYNEIPNNSIDDDANGYIDDYIGWDFGGLTGTPDNNPMEDRSDHGTHVAGISSAVTDNGIGVASIGFKTKIMAVKTSQDNYRNSSGQPYIAFGYEGIKYAADNGCKVINCSWGGGGYSVFGQEMIDYAVSKGALVVTAAGNSNSSSPFYPAAYKGVLSVASTDQGDLKSGFSNYGITVDVSAPGSGILSTWMNDTYTTLSGTSMASPLTAGLAALVFAQFPAYNPLQVGEQIRVTSDDINQSNPNYQNLLGRGRINAQNALTLNTSESVRFIDYIFSDNAPGGNGNGIIENNETITLTLTFVNYLQPTSNLGIYLESKNAYSEVLQGMFIAGGIGTMQQFDNSSAKFTFKLSASVPLDAKLLFSINYLDGVYADFQPIEVIANPNYATQAGNDIAMTITSKGNLGFNDYSSNLQGSGFKYLDGDNLMFEGGLMLTSNGKISDVVRGANSSTQNVDFIVETPIKITTPGVIADQEGLTVFNDNHAAQPIGVSIKLRSYAFAAAPNNNYIILRYTVSNISASDITNLYTGIFIDWDLTSDGSDDFTAYDTVGQFGYAQHIGGANIPWVGTGVVSNTANGYWGILNPGGDGGFQIYDGFTDAEKIQALTSGIGKAQAGGGDISCVVSAGPVDIPASTSVDIAFAIASGLEKVDLNNAFTNARSKFQVILTDVGDKNDNVVHSFDLAQNYPNPFNPSTTIKYTVPNNVNSQWSIVNLKVYDILGNEIATLVNENKPAGNYEAEFNATNLSSGVYFYKLTAGGITLTKKMVLLR
ncbi:MAG: S8 family peptidase, partial [Ignavibacteriaceae bacterium]|nr:S8 family peptidase [Ignavibacteriaceae bacterium]